MSPQLQVDDEVFEELKRRAVPFEDKEPNDVLRRILIDDTPVIATPGISGSASNEVSSSGPAASSGRATRSRSGRRSKSKKRTRTPSSALLPETEYRAPILVALSNAGGRMPTSEAVAAVGEMVEDKLMPADVEMLGNRPRWESRVQFTRLRLVEEGLMRNNSPRGLWEITEAGEKAASRYYRDKAVVAGALAARGQAVAQ